MLRTKFNDIASFRVYVSALDNYAGINFSKDTNNENTFNVKG
jgi:hypothetical protein